MLLKNSVNGVDNAFCAVHGCGPVVDDILAENVVSQSKTKPDNVTPGKLSVNYFKEDSVHTKALSRIKCDKEIPILKTDQRTMHSSRPTTFNNGYVVVVSDTK